MSWIWMEGGVSMPSKKTFRQRIALWFGYRLAVRHKKVKIAKSCLISPESRINPRNGSINIGERCSIAPGAVIQGNVEIGNDCSVQINSIIIGYGTEEKPEGKIRIGNHVRIAPNVMILGANHNFEDGNRPIHEQGLTFKTITIEDDVWIAGRVNIMAGVTIGKGSVIGAGSVVTKDIEPYSIAVGVPAKVIKKREKKID